MYKNEKLIIIGQHNKLKADRTHWYTITQKLAKLLNYNMWENSQLQVGKIPIASGRNSTAIPDIKPDLKPNDKSFCSSNNLKAQNAKKHSWAEKPKSAFATIESQSTSFQLHKYKRADEDIANKHIALSRQILGKLR